MKIICVGRNYAQHAAEMGATVPSEPVLFIKPDSALLRENKPFYIPEWTQAVHYECEVFYRIGKKGKYISARHALPYIDGVGLGIDFTARDVQETCKQQGLPWEKAKAFHDSAAVSEVLPLEAFPDPYRLDFELRVNGETRQKAHTDEMLFTLPQIMEHASRYFLVKIGDFVFTGTPAGVGPVQIGDHLEGFLNGRKLLDFYIK